MLLSAAILLTALLSVGLTAAADSPFTIAFRPAFVRLDPDSNAESKARLFAFDIDIKVGTIHLHFTWPGISVFPASTKLEPRPF